MKHSDAYQAAARRVKNLPRIFGRVSAEKIEAGILGTLRKHDKLTIRNVEAVFIPDDAEYEELPDGTRKLPCLFYGDIYFEKEEEDA